MKKRLLFISLVLLGSISFANGSSIDFPMTINETVKVRSSTLSVGTDTCITTDDIINCIASENCSNAYDLNRDGAIDVADVQTVVNASLNNMCYVLNSYKTNDTCITTEDIKHCIFSGNCGSAYDLNKDGDINVLDMQIVINESLNNSACYMLDSFETNNTCITTDDITNCIASNNCGSGYDLNGDGAIDVADIQTVINASQNNMCYTLSSLKTNNACITTDDIVNCIASENCGSEYDLNGDGAIDAADIQTAINASLNNMCYVASPVETNNTCITTDDVINCIASENCGSAYDLNRDGAIDVADVQTVINASQNNMCYILSSYETRNVCITSNDITECVAGGNCNSMHDLNGDGVINGEDIQLTINAANNHACYLSDGSITNDVCITTDDITNCVNSGNCGSAYDLNGDGVINGMDTQTVINASQNNMCYVLNSFKTNNICITTDDIINCIASENCSSAYDLNRDGAIDAADIQTTINASQNNMCYTLSSLKTNNACITTDDIINCIASENCGSEYDLNGDGDIDVADVQTVINASQNNMCYVSSPVETNNTCITREDVINCIASENCGSAYDLNKDGAIDVADVQAAINSSLNNMCYVLSSFKTYNTCITTDDVINCISLENCGSAYDLNRDGVIDVADAQTAINASLDNSCYKLGSSKIDNVGQGSGDNHLNSFPAFPMTIYGNIKIGSSNLNGGTLKVYNSSNQELASYNINQDGKYGSDNVTIEPLLLNKFGGSLTFKVSYNGKSYVVDSIDDSNKGNLCPSKSSITFVSENCRYDITLKEEPSTNSGGSTSSGSGGKKSGSSSNGTSSNNTKSDASKTKLESIKSEIKTDNHNAANEDLKIKADKRQTETNTKNNRKIVNISQGNPTEVLGNGYTREQNNAYSFSYANGITSVKDIKDAKVNGPLTRIAMAKMLSYYAINVLGKTPDASKTVKFDDVSAKLNAQYNNAVVLSYQLGIMGQNMKNNNFRPNDEVSRAEFVTALSRMLYGTQDGKGNTKYYEPHMTKLYQEGIISKTDPKIKEKRGYVMTMLMRSAG